MRALFLILFISFVSAAFSQDAFKTFLPKKEFKNTLPHQFKILLWNVHKGEADELWKKDFSKLISQYDILALQEAYLIPLMKDTFEKLSEHQVHMGISFNYKNRGETGVATVSRFSPLEVRALKSPITEFWYNTPKTSLISLYQIEGSQNKLLLINSHALNYDWGSRYKKQLLSLAEIIKKHHGPVIWIGDFNTWSDHREKICFDIALQLGLKKVEFLDDQRSTFMFGHAVDHIFFKDVELDEVKVLADIESSDHKPISLVLSIK